MIDRINLIPEELLIKKKAVKFPLKYVVIMAFGLMFILSLHMSISKKIREVDEKKVKLEKKKLELVTSNMRFASLKAEMEKMISEIEEIKRTSKALRGVLKKRIYWSDVLKELSFMVPKKLWLSEISSRDITLDTGKEGDETVTEKTYKEITIKGGAYKNETIKDFIKGLEESYFLDNIKLIFIKKRIINKIHTTYEFEIRSRLKGKD